MRGAPGHERGVDTAMERQVLPFQAEIDAFEKALPGLLADHHAGQFVVLKSCNIEQVLPTYEQALNWGYQRYGLDEQFFVKQVLETQQQTTHIRRIRQGGR